MDRYSPTRNEEIRKDMAQVQAAQEQVKVESNYIQRLYDQRNQLQRKLDRLNKQIELMHNNSVIGQFLDLA